MELAELIDRIERWKQGGKESSSSAQSLSGRGGGRSAASRKSLEEPDESPVERADMEEGTEVGEEDYEIDGEDITSEDDEA